MKKRAVVFALAMSLAASVAGCSGKKETEKATEAKATEAAKAAEAATEAEKAVAEAMSEATGMASGAVEATSEAAAEMMSEATGVAAEAVEAASEAAAEMMSEASGMAAGAAEATSEAAAEMMSEASGMAAEAVEATSEAAAEAMSEASGMAAGAVEAASEAAAEMMSEATGAVAEAAAVDEIELPKRDKPYVAAVLVPGTLGDKSFWDSTNEGLTALKEELGEDMFSFDIQEMGEGADDMASYPDFFLDAAESGKYDVIITGSWTALDAMNEAMEQFPDQKFILFDEEYDFSNGGENLYNVLFKQNEVSYLVGAAAALLSKTDTICFLGGMEGNVINDFLVGYIDGAKAVKDNIKVAVSFVGNYEDSAKGKDLSLAMFNAGADVGYNVAGGAGMGILEAAKEADKLAFGVDSDQAGLNPDLAPYIPTSALKNVGAGLSRAIKLDMAGKLAYGSAETLGFAENGVELLDDAHYQEMVPEEIREQVAQLQEKITAGEIEVLTSKNMTAEEIDELKASVSVEG